MLKWDVIDFQVARGGGGQANTFWLHYCEKLPLLFSQGLQKESWIKACYESNLVRESALDLGWTSH